MPGFGTDTHPRLIVFTDLDGTLLDHHTYAWDAARPALQRLQQLGVALILATSKTLAEVRELARDLHLFYPCIVENGAGVAWPSGPEPEYELENLSCDRDHLLELLAPLHRRYAFRSCAQMDAEEFAHRTGLDLPAAARALQRDFTEPLVWMDSDERRDQFVDELQSAGLQVLQGGRFLHLMGDSDKGRAMERVIRSWAGQRSDFRSLALGDSPNDIAMLERADYAVVVRSDHHAAPDFRARGRKITTGQPGPAGWNQAVMDLLDQLDMGSIEEEG